MSYEGVPVNYGPASGIPVNYGPASGIPVNYGPASGMPVNYGPASGIPLNFELESRILIGKKTFVLQHFRSLELSMGTFPLVREVY